MRILIVEDERDLLHSIAVMLRDEGFAVDTAADGELGLHHALNYDYNAILLDVMLPKLNGWDLLARLRAKKSTPVLMLTARDQVPDRVRGLDTGADDYVVKPFEFDELTARLRAVIRRNPGQAKSIIEIGGLKIDTALRLVAQHGKNVELTAREYRVLEVLARHRGEVITREQLFERLADATEDTGTNLLDVHVFNLRKKLGAELITTRRGQGYCIE